MSRSILELYNHISVQQYKTDMGFKALVEGVHDNLFVCERVNSNINGTISSGESKFNYCKSPAFVI